MVEWDGGLIYNGQGYYSVEMMLIIECTAVCLTLITKSVVSYFFIDRTLEDDERNFILLV
jgi:hypothetical protein